MLPSFLFVDLHCHGFIHVGQGLRTSHPATRSTDVPAQCHVLVCFTSPQDWKSSVRAGTCFALVSAVFPAGTQSGPPSSEEPRTWGRKRAILSAFCTVWCLAPHRGDQHVSVNGWREAGESDGGYGMFLPLPFGNGEWAHLLNIKMLV